MSITGPVPCPISLNTIDVAREVIDRQGYSIWSQLILAVITSRVADEVDDFLRPFQPSPEYQKRVSTTERVVHGEEQFLQASFGGAFTDVIEIH